MANQLASINHVVQLMLENRSFDQMLGFLYANNGNRSPSGQPFDGLTGNESNPDRAGRSVPVFKIDDDHPHPYFMPGADLGRDRCETKRQIVDGDTAKFGFEPTGKTVPPNQTGSREVDIEIAQHAA